ncbi:RNA binding protein, heterogenous nuclear RNP-K like protein [Mycoemilia scoparia]|uniref:RNA binding protein, heterogenous nuclear RNP-K like protein n=1 Tax=Mycoemilia scoparia TaxID=417184 RepID=A0A9W8A4U9_9FUNG|nr:RNA binding protein, heterogenous nuclear RNP-K like protein [Mycoemilia scoparia]
MSEYGYDYMDGAGREHNAGSQFQSDESGKRRVTLSDYWNSRSNLALRGNGSQEDFGAGQNVEPTNEMEELRQLLGANFDSTNGAGNGIAPGVFGMDFQAGQPPETPGGSPTHMMVESTEDPENFKADRNGESGGSHSQNQDRDRGRNSSGRKGRRNRSRDSRDYRSRSSDRSPSRRRHSRSPDSRCRTSDRRTNSRENKGSSHARSSRRDRSSSRDKKRLSMRSVFAYEDGGIIIGSRGVHLSKLRRTVPEVEWNISTESNDKQDRVLEIKGPMDKIAEAYQALADHFISQNVHIDFPLPVHSSNPRENVDTSEPFVAIRLLLPHKTCGAIIGRNSETLIETRIKCRARRLYVYRDRIPSTRERVVEIIGTPISIKKIFLELGKQVERTLADDQADSTLYRPARDGIRKFLRSQDVQESKVTLEPLNRGSTSSGTRNNAKAGSSDRGHRRRSRRGSIGERSDKSNATPTKRSDSRNRSSRRRGSRSRSSSRKRRRDRSYDSRSRSPASKSTRYSHNRSSNHGRSSHRQDANGRDSDKKHPRKPASQKAMDDEAYSINGSSTSLKPKDAVPSLINNAEMQQKPAKEYYNPEESLNNDDNDDAQSTSSSSSWDIPTHNRRKPALTLSTPQHKTRSSRRNTNAAFQASSVAEHDSASGGESDREYQDGWA